MLRRLRRPTFVVLAAALLATLISTASPLEAQQATGGSHTMSMPHDSAGRRVVPMHPGMSMKLGIENARPSTEPWLPGEGIDPATLLEAEPNHLTRLSDGDTLDLTAGLVRREIGGRTVVMYAFNRQYPGPLIRVPQDAGIVVRFKNGLSLPSTIHWHGLRLDNPNDGVPYVTQEPVPPGGTFTYHVRFPDAGVYWYHPHVRGDIEIPLGLYGNEVVDSPDPDYYSPVDREEPLVLADLLMDDQGIFPFGKDTSDFAIMGRFGNVFLVDGEPDWRMEVNRGDVVRFWITDVSNTRSYNLVFGGNPIKLVGADLSKFEREKMVESVPITVAERYIVEVRFPRAGTFALTNQVQAVDQVKGEFYSEVDTLGTIVVSNAPSAEDHAAEFATLRENQDVERDIDRYRKYFDQPPDKRLELTVNIQGLPAPVAAFLAADTLYYPPVEWNDGMPMMNWIATAHEVRWILRDTDTGRENMDIDWHFETGQVVKIRLHNDPGSMHPMNHPIHFHGQRFLVLARDGVPNDDLAWKDTVLVPVGRTVDILMDASNPGKWLAHCHIAEHIDAGMKLVFTVGPAP